MGTTIVITLVVASVLCPASANAQTTAAAQPGDILQDSSLPLWLRLLGEGQQPLTQVTAEKVPGLPLALSRLSSRNTCAATVGGQWQRYATSRLLNTEYDRLPSLMISAVQMRNGIQYLYALSNVSDRRVLLFPAFHSPKSVLTGMPEGGPVFTDSLRAFETALGFIKGSLTEEKLQAIMLLHEQLHLNGTDIDDSLCLILSVLNTRRVAQSCFPELLDTEVKPTWMSGGISSKAASNCKGCHDAMNVRPKPAKPANPAPARKARSTGDSDAARKVGA